jgi:hypothetical protein
MTAAGVINFDTETQDVLYYTSNATGAGILNIRGNSTTALGSLIIVGQSRTIVFLNTNSTTAYVPSFTIDGAAIGGALKWSNGTSTGNASAVDLISVTIVKTAATPTYNIFASITKFA